MKKIFCFIFLIAQLSFCQTWQDYDDRELDKLTPPRDSKEYAMGSFYAVVAAIAFGLWLYSQRNRNK